MADTLDNITIPAGEWVDLYAESGITVGTKIVAENLSAVYARLHTSALIPDIEKAVSDETGAYSILPPFSEKSNETGDSGAWAYSRTGCLLNVRVA